MFLRVKLLKEHCTITVISWHSLATKQYFVPEYRTKLINNKTATSSCRPHYDYKLFTLTERFILWNTHNKSPEISTSPQIMFSSRLKKCYDIRTINSLDKVLTGELVLYIALLGYNIHSTTVQAEDILWSYHRPF